MVDFTTVSDFIVQKSLEYAPKLLLAIFTFIIGLWIIGRIVMLFEFTLDKRNVDDSLRHFLGSLVDIAMKVLLVIIVVGMVGVETTSLVAVLAAAGFAIGLALQGSLSNFAGGVLILIFKPFRVGDFIDSQGFKGKVSKIEVFNTVMKTPDNKTIILPNGQVSNNPIINFSTEKTRRVDMVFGIAYDNDFDKAKKLIEDLVKKDKRIMKDPEPFIKVTALADSSVNITARLWVNSADYWGVNFDMQENVKKQFDKHKISIPFPQMELHMKK